MIELYTIYAAGAGRGQAVSFTNEHDAIEEAEQVLRVNPEISEIGIYKLLKIGKRRTSVDWSGDTSGDEPEAKSNGQKLKLALPIAKGTTHHYQEWTSGEFKYLQEAHKAGFSYDEIAEDLGRTKRAVEVQASRLRQEY